MYSYPFPPADFTCIVPAVSLRTRPRCSPAQLFLSLCGKCTGFAAIHAAHALTPGIFFGRSVITIPVAPGLGPEKASCCRVQIFSLRAYRRPHSTIRVYSQLKTTSRLYNPHHTTELPTLPTLPAVSDVPAPILPFTASPEATHEHGPMTTPHPCIHASQYVYQGAG